MLFNTSLVYYAVALLVWSIVSGNKPRISINDQIIRQIESSMNLEVNPCENFYQYSCGKWYQQHIDQMEYGDTMGMLEYNLNKKLEDIIRKSALNATEESYEFEEYSESIYEKLLTYYKSCKKVKPYNLKKYLHLVTPGLGVNWFVNARSSPKSWNSEGFHWLTATAKLRLYGLNGVFLKEQVLPRWDESSSYSIYLDKPTLVESEPMTQGSMIEMFLDIGITKRVANDLSRDVDHFQLHLHRLHEIEDSEGPKEMQLSFLLQYLPDFDWLDYFAQIKGPTTNLDTTLIVQNIPYMRGLVRLLSTADKPTVCNYLMLKFLFFLKSQGPAEISKQECIGSLRRVMPLAISFIIEKHYYKHPDRDDAIIQEMFQIMKMKFNETLLENRLELDQGIVNSLTKKIANMKLQVGNSPRNTSNDFYVSYYSRVELDPNNFYVNQLSLLRLAVERDHELLEEPYDANITTSDNCTFQLSEWQGGTSSPLYIQARNMIIIPYSFMQMPIYHHNMLQTFKYAVLGYHMAREVFHGFDSTGIEYDMNGNMMGPSEYIAANPTFMYGLRCIQHDGPTGPNILNERLADYEGLRLAYNTFVDYSVRKDPRRYPIQKKFSEEKLFFIFYTQFFCGKLYHSVRHKTFIGHYKEERRVMKILGNFEGFNSNFNCHNQTRMHTRQPCLLW